MKYILAIIFAIFAFASLASAETACLKKTGCGPAPILGGGGPAIMYNLTTKSYDMLPQCFPETFLRLFLAGDISAIYENQKACQEQRKIDFGL